MDDDALFWTPGFSFQPSTEIPEGEEHHMKSKRRQQERHRVHDLRSQSLFWGTYRCGLWPVLILERKGLATSMKCFGFDRGCSAKKPKTKHRRTTLRSFKISSISTSRSRYQAFLPSPMVDILPCTPPSQFVPSYSFLLWGSSVITIFFGMRMSFHRGAGGGGVGGFSGHARALVSRTMWLCSRERPY